MGSIKLDCGLGWPRHKTRFYLKNNQSKKGWRHDSSGSKKFKLQYHQNNNEKHTWQTIPRLPHLASL
jgi:hypothetical protein